MKGSKIHDFITRRLKKTQKTKNSDFGSLRAAPVKKVLCDLSGNMGRKCLKRWGLTVRGFQLNFYSISFGNKSGCQKVKKKRQFMVLFSIPGPVFTTKLRKDIDHYPMQMQLSTFFLSGRRRLSRQSIMSKNAKITLVSTFFRCAQFKLLTKN